MDEEPGARPSEARFPWLSANTELAKRRRKGLQPVSSEDVAGVKWR